VCVPTFFPVALLYAGSGHAMSLVSKDLFMNQNRPDSLTRDIKVKLSLYLLSGHLHAPATLSPGKKPSVAIG
jgi:hypothetical protein